MTTPVLLHGALATHRRGKILSEALAAEAATTLPEGGAVVVAFADGFQGAEAAEQVRLIEWTRTPGHTLLLVPPFAANACERPVAWRSDRLESSPRGSEGLAKILASEVTHRLDGKLQTPSVPGATWSDLSICLGTFRLHPAAGVFAVTCLPVWSLTVLDAPQELQRWLTSLVAFAGEAKPPTAPTTISLAPDHYGLLVFLLSKAFDSEDMAIAALGASSILRMASSRARAVLGELRTRGLVVGVQPTSEATELVMRSPYAIYVLPLRELINP